MSVVWVPELGAEGSHLDWRLHLLMSTFRAPAGGRGLRESVPGSSSLGAFVPFWSGGNLKGWRGWRALGPAVGATATLQSRGWGWGGVGVLQEHVGRLNVCLLLKFGREAGSRRKPQRPRELELSLGAV